MDCSGLFEVEPILCLEIALPARTFAMVSAEGIALPERPGKEITPITFQGQKWEASEPRSQERYE
jgi:hypothetical protein